MKAHKKSLEIAHARLNRQYLIEPAGSIVDVVDRLCAVQGQDYGHSHWAFGVRMKRATQEMVEAAIADGTIVRTWPMRGTLHLVHASDARWMLRLLAPDMLTRHARRLRELGITPSMIDRSQSLMRDALAGGRRLSRSQLYSVLEAGGIANRELAYHLFWVAAMNLVICIGPREGKQATFVLFDEWVPPSPDVPRDEALARIATRYYTGHGPATVSDFGWWAGLKAGDARNATLSAAGLEYIQVDGREYWFPSGALDLAGRPRTVVLPAYDEYLVAYRDRSAVLAPESTRRVNAGGGLLEPTIVRGGRVVATWKRRAEKKRTAIIVAPFEATSATWKREVERAFRPWIEFYAADADITYRE